jgi:dTDP-4-dehydrorhamnose reductase
MQAADNMRVLILGANGMLGHAVLRYFHQRQRYRVAGSVRSAASLRQLPQSLRQQVIANVDVENTDSLAALFAQVRPQAVINCVGLVKQLAQAEDPLSAIPINSLLPHRLARLCAMMDARLVHISTDCVFSGSRGLYAEADPADAQDLYGRSKLLGEVDYPHAVTLRTSIIGPELGSAAHGLLGWFLAQEGAVSGYAKAIFSGLPTLARVIHDVVLPHEALRGLYHVASAPIDKCTLLQLIARTYGKTIDIKPDDRVVVDRSLDASRFQAATHYVPRSWPELLREMYDFG